jgi:dTDP-4-amino-4,6-dideoxygalactose transaminase
MIAAGIGPGDEVITTAMTFCATVNAIIHSGATPVLADIDPYTFNIDPEQIRNLITGRTKAIVPVHFAGHPCDMDEVMSIAHEYDLKVIEDCAHTIEAKYKDQNTGTIGDFGCFSFYVTKNMTTGEGGMVIAKSENDIARVKRLSLHGLSNDAWHRFSDAGYKHYQIVECGYKYNMMDIQAAIGIHQLERVNAWWLRRKEIWDKYQEAFKELPLQLPCQPHANIRHAYHLYTLLIDESKCGVNRDSFLDSMTDLNIGIGVHYLSIPEHPYYKQKYGWQMENYPNATRVGRQTVSLPLSAKLTDSDVEDVINAVKYTLGRTPNK